MECKLTESEVGTCSRPRITEKDPIYKREYCDGRYARQLNRKERCSLTELKIEYWKYIPILFNWTSDIDLDPCPLRDTYQLVRNVLAACVSPDKEVGSESGHAVLLYDERNPAFQSGGKGRREWDTVRKALKNPALLQQCTWQQVMGVMRRDSELSWLTELLQIKYGF